MGTMNSTRMMLHYSQRGLNVERFNYDLLPLLPRLQIVCAVPPYQIGGDQDSYETEKRGEYEAEVMKCHSMPYGYFVNWGFISPESWDSSRLNVRFSSSSVVLHCGHPIFTPRPSCLDHPMQNPNRAFPSASAMSCAPLANDRSAISRTVFSVLHQSLFS